MFHIGQRWYSEGEPELGLGTVMGTQDKRVTILFSLSGTERIYSSNNSPLKRFSLSIGDEFVAQDEKKYIIESVEEKDNRLFYFAGDEIRSEISLNPKIDLAGPIDRLMAQSFDSNQFFDLRYKTYLATRNYEQFNYKGFLGAKVNLIPHQVYLANEVLTSPSPKFMLCDEVGLGKTIEASLVIHSLIQQELTQSALIVVPESLVNQWFVELFKKFSLSFKAVSLENIEDLDITNSQRYIVSSSLLREESSVSDFISSVNWDMIVVDESHQIPFHKEEMFLTTILKEIVTNAHAALFLSATPEVMGVENLFYQLKTLDPERYIELDAFKDQNKKFQGLSSFIQELKLETHNPKELLNYFTADEIKERSNDQLAHDIVDRFGQGRSYFRNSRSSLEKTQNLFTKRVLHDYPIERPKVINDTVVVNEKVNIVREVLLKIKEEKLLILCHSKDLVKKIHKKLLEQANFKIAEFHSEQSLLERDRQAAYFADPEGARILICTEIGSEGRNFEFSHHLVLFDLPKLPDQLEQRIGRLDRIGQKKDVNIHVPFIKQSFEEVLFRWYNEVLESFSKFPKGAFSFYQEHKETLTTLIETAETSHYDTKLEELRKLYLTRQDELEKGRDFLIEMRSYDEKKALEIVSSIREYEKKDDCRSFLSDICNAVGINFEPLNDDAYYIKPSDNMLLPSYPGLTEDGLSITFNRGYANRYPNIDYMSWEHPVIKAAFELLLSSPLGNTTFTQTLDLPRNIYFEFMIVARTKGEFRHESSKYFPYTPFRALLDIEEGNRTNEISKKMLDNVHFERMNEDALTLMKSIPKDKITTLGKKAVASVQQRITKLKESALNKIEKDISHERSRIQAFKIDSESKNKTLAALKLKEDHLVKEVSEAQASLDSIRVIFPKE